MSDLEPDLFASQLWPHFQRCGYGPSTVLRDVSLPEVFRYRLGNRSALEWIIDQYHVSTDKRSGITNDPNREDDPQYIVRLIGQVITARVETTKAVRSLAGESLFADKPYEHVTF